MSSINDTLQRFLFTEYNIRGQLVYLDDSIKTILDTGNYPAELEHYITQLSLAVTLITGTLKYQGNITIQFATEDQSTVLIAQCDHNFQYRTTISQASKTDLSALNQHVSAGQLIVTARSTIDKQPYQAIVPIIDNDICASLTEYYRQSEQTQTLIHFSKEPLANKAIMLQALPGKTLDHKTWQELSFASEKILLSLNDDQSLNNLLTKHYKQSIEILKPSKIKFNCSCSKDKVTNALISMGTEDIKQQIKQKQPLDIHCQFCGKQYQITPTDLKALIAKINQQNKTND